ncbi:hypothetical protein R2B67_19405 [Streptomyces cyaneofuscatus]|uniref:hypothetical protein n=1 Tax=Streptomyces cyaneofuscatus TaxID=66883 RepID=UPI00295505D1|nr:hypothetical protein [Streptomyces cyaneofuscatus]WOP10572.1 hypothetical protein R2B67_19405 [Streptomyces cyaneofuscatus]
MPNPRRMSRRAWVLTGAGLCGAGLAATAWLQGAASPPEARPERHVKAECREYIAEIEGQLDRARRDGGEKSGILTFMPVGMDCKDELNDLLGDVR